MIKNLDSLKDKKLKLLESKEVIEFLNLLGYSITNTTENSSFLNSGVYSSHFKKCFCRCGAVIEFDNSIDIKKFNCLLCNNDIWALDGSVVSNRYKKIESEITINKENSDEICFTKYERKYRIVWETNSIELKSVESKLYFNIKSKNFYSKSYLKNGTEKIVPKSEKGYLINDYNYSNVKEFMNLYNSMVDRYERINEPVSYSFNYVNTNLIAIRYKVFRTLSEQLNNKNIINDYFGSFDDNYEHKLDILNLEGTNAKDIFQISKGSLNIILSKNLKLSETLIRKVQHLESVYGFGTTHNILNFLNHRSYRIIDEINRIEILLKNNLNLKHIESYFNSAIENQGFTDINSVLVIYSDYIRMSNDMRVDFIKNPKSLRLLHDVRAKDYKVLLDENEVQVFKNRYIDSNLNGVIYSKDNYVLLSPKEPLEVIIEGQELNHCVSSYVNRIVRGESLILFLRRVDDCNKSLVTIELDIGLNIIQAKGRNNRNLLPDEYNFIKQLSIAKKLNLLI